MYEFNSQGLNHKLRVVATQPFFYFWW